ncbi:transcriptional regulator, MerR family [Halopseudomonas xinjiangensis]|uniref:Transcriptional regulator, MerR family n=1 Tax=Halopseudomonas xinjiangensis TaxID=487184 RepID=A0A1H1VS28_9GAMM|nr:MerR family transcriptional regulator [Halopseudomonas xinjiangensis]SDS87707.1 transcriptional regulator, MerR family [Halopseudomonas xinjiangensis]
MNDDTLSSASLVRMDLDSEELYPIREVSRLTGVNPVTLRAWERRYGLLVPHRTESGHRLYSMADIERVRAVTAWIERGVAVSKVGSIIDRQAPPPEARRSPRPVQLVDTPLPDDMQPWQERLIDAVAQFSVGALDRIYGQVFASYPLPVVINSVLLPVWRRLHGQPAPGTSPQWAFFDSFVRMRLSQRVGYVAEGVPTVLVTCLPGPLRELDVLLVAACVAEAGCNVSILPITASFPDIHLAAQRSSVAAVVLIGSRSLDAEILKKRLPRLERALDCPLAIAGAVCQLHHQEMERSGIACLGDPGQALLGKIRSLLAGRLDVR